MELNVEVKKEDFDFSQQKIINDNKKKTNKRYTSFLIMGVLALGILSGLEAHKLLVKHKNFLELKLKQEQKHDQDFQNERIRGEYDFLLGNKEGLMYQYETQMTRYDKPYGILKQSAELNLITKEDFKNVTNLYIEYKENIATKINFIEKETESVEKYKNLPDVQKAIIQQEIEEYIKQKRQRNMFDNTIVVKNNSVLEIKFLDALLDNNKNDTPKMKELRKDMGVKLIHEINISTDPKEQSKDEVNIDLNDYKNSNSTSKLKM